jgi:hypothetical protein
VSEATAASKAARRTRPRNTATIIKAAKAAGATSVTFPDGTVVSLMPPIDNQRDTDQQVAI